MPSRRRQPAGPCPGDPVSPDFARRAMTLLHEFNVLSEVFPRFPAAAGVESLAELAALLWDLDAPGLVHP